MNQSQAIIDMVEVLTQRRMRQDNVKVQDDIYDSHRGEAFGQITVAMAGRLLGRLDYSIYEGEATIQWIEVGSDVRGQGFAELMIRELMSANNAHDAVPYRKINWGMSTPEGTRLKQSMDRKLR